LKLPLSIKTKLSISLSLILLIAFVAINLLSYNVSREALRRNIIGDALPGISKTIYLELQRELLLPIQASSQMAHDTFLRDWVMNGEQDRTKITKYLREIKKKYGFSSTFLISSRTLNYYHGQGLLKKINPGDPHDVWYYNFLKKNKEYVLDVDTNEAAQGALTIFINYRLTDYQGKLLGVTGVGLNMKQLGRKLHAFEKRYGKRIYMVDRAGVVQAHRDLGLVGKHNIHKQEGLAEIAEFVLAQTSDAPVSEYDASDQHMILISRYIPELDWFLIVEHFETLSMKGIREAFIRNLAIGTAVTILVIIINVLMVNFFQGKLERLATEDELTSLPNRRYFLAQARRELAQTIRYKRTLSLVMIDIDEFKQVNDTMGHPVGDQVLVETAQLMRQVLREGDLAGRMGGEEFAVLLPQTSDDEAREVAERLRRVVERWEVECGQSCCRVTISLGVATFRDSEETVESLLRRADQALYDAKREGRNRVCAQRA
jgi:diguanylate cyclase (GGDEF)-like protein